MSPRSVATLLVLLCLLCCSVHTPVGAVDDQGGFCQSKDLWCDDPGYRPPRFADDEVLRVSALQAPLFYQIFHDLLGQLDLFHAGISFHSQTTSAEVVFSYEAIYEVPNATFPYVINDTIKWCNAGAVCMTSEYNSTYWVKRQDIGFITGAVANTFVDWIPQANLTFSRYMLWNIKSQLPARNMAFSFTCADFVFAAASKLLELGGEINPKTQPHRDNINLFGKSLLPVDINNATVYQDVLTFFKTYESFHSDSFVHGVEDLVEYAVGNKYVSVNGEFYQVIAEPPYLDVTYTASPICNFDEWASTRCEEFH